jgi:hypothetical protein
MTLFHGFQANVPPPRVINNVETHDPTCREVKCWLFRKLCIQRRPRWSEGVVQGHIEPMKQEPLELNLSTKKTRKREFVEPIEQVVPWVQWVTLIAPYPPEGRLPFFCRPWAAPCLMLAPNRIAIERGQF